MEIQKALRQTKRVGIDTGPGKTEQAHKQQCDMNYILRDYQRTGLIKHAVKYEGQYDDVSDVDYQRSMMIVADVKNMFESLPSSERKKFSNDPAKFLNYVQDAANRQDLEERGILSGIDGKVPEKYKQSIEDVSQTGTSEDSSEAV
jgi:phage internal scaffolding protein